MTLQNLGSHFILRLEPNGGIKHPCRFHRTTEFSNLYPGRVIKFVCFASGNLILGVGGIDNLVGKKNRIDTKIDDRQTDRQRQGIICEKKNTGKKVWDSDWRVLTVP